MDVVRAHGVFMQERGKKTKTPKIQHNDILQIPVEMDVLRARSVFMQERGKKTKTPNFI
jgi:hypothetical protein